MNLHDCGNGHWTVWRICPVCTAIIVRAKNFDPPVPVIIPVTKVKEMTKAERQAHAKRVADKLNAKAMENIRREAMSAQIRDGAVGP